MSKHFLLGVSRVLEITQQLLVLPWYVSRITCLEDKLNEVLDAINKERDDWTRAIKDRIAALEQERHDWTRAIKELRQNRIALEQEHDDRTRARKEANEQMWDHLGEIVGRVEALQMWATTQVRTTCGVQTYILIGSICIISDPVAGGVRPSPGTASKD